MVGERLRVAGDGGKISKLHRQTGLGKQVKDIGCARKKG